MKHSSRHLKETDLAQDLRDFIGQFIGSVEQLEILKVLYEDPQRAWSSEEVFQAVQSSESSVANCLEMFCESGLVQRDSLGAYRYQPQNPNLVQAMTRLLEAYSKRRVAVIETIYRSPPSGVRR